MNDSMFSDETSRLFLLCTIELATAVFRGMSTRDCLNLCEDGLADLHPLYKADKGALADLCEGITSLEQLCDSHSDDRTAFCERCATEYVRLFVSNRDGIPAPLYASCYEEQRQVMAAPAMSMHERLAEAGLEPAGGSNEPPDHISIQLEYLYFLLSTGWRDDDKVARDHAAEFVRKEMLPWTQELACRLSRHDSSGFFSGTATILTTLLRHIAA